MCFSTFETALTVSFIVFVKTSSEFVAADKSVSELCALLSSNTESAFAGFAIRAALKLVRSAAEIIIFSTLLASITQKNRLTSGFTSF
ncbi:hypothetical protein ACGO3R_01810 [Lactococcus lactis]